MTLTEVDMYIAIGVAVYIISLVGVWQFGRDQLLLQIRPFIDQYEADLSKARKDAFEAQAKSDDIERRLNELQHEYVRSRVEMLALKRRQQQQQRRG